MNSICHASQVDITIELNFKIRLFKAACKSILLYGCQTWILTEALIEKLEILARIMLGIKQSRDHVTNESLIHPTGQALLRERQLQFTARLTKFFDH